VLSKHKALSSNPKALLKKKVFVDFCGGAHTHNPSYQGFVDRIIIEASSRRKAQDYLKITKAKKGWGSSGKVPA
jgi:hypothetical protein